MPSKLRLTLLRRVLYAMEEAKTRSDKREEMEGSYKEQNEANIGKKGGWERMKAGVGGASMKENKVGRCNWDWWTGGLEGREAAGLGQ
jgi:hypothetical protein